MEMMEQEIWEKKEGEGEVKSSGWACWSASLGWEWEGLVDLGRGGEWESVKRDEGPKARNTQYRALLYSKEQDICSGRTDSAASRQGKQGRGEGMYSPTDYSTGLAHWMGLSPPARCCCWLLRRHWTPNLLGSRVCRMCCLSVVAGFFEN